MIRIFRVTGPKPELQAKSQSYSRGGPPESELHRPEKEPERGLGASTENPLKACLNPPKIFTFLSKRCFVIRGTLSYFFSNMNLSESVSTGVWCVPGFGAGFEIALEPSKLLK